MNIDDKNKNINKKLDNDTKVPNKLSNIPENKQNINTNQNALVDKNSTNRNTLDLLIESLDNLREQIKESNNQTNNQIKELTGYIKGDLVYKDIHSDFSDLPEHSKYVKYNEKGRDAEDIGKIETRKYRNYYDVRHTITTALSSDPNDFDNASYNREQIYTNLERYSKILRVINDGKDNLFVIISHGGTTSFSNEARIEPGEIKEYYNVYELRLRSPTAGLSYRVTEYKIDAGDDVTAGITDATNAIININTIGDNTIIAAPGAGIKIKILKLLFVCSGAVSVTLKSDANNLSGAMAFSANGGMGFDGDFTPLETNANEAFVISLAGNAQVSGFALYITET